ncbi:MAG: hypothetical protein FJW44_09850 [Actinobacteria bacterium]|nr:hypothetical protein [Actinomycetota bacterium]
MSRRVLIGPAFGAEAGGLRPTIPASPESSAFLTPESDFFVIDTVGAMRSWLVASASSLRIHGMVDKEVTLRYGDVTSPTWDASDPYWLQRG